MLANREPVSVDRPAAEGQRNIAALRSLGLWHSLAKDFKNPATLLFTSGMLPLEDDTVARRKRAGQLDFDALAAHPHHAADQHAVLRRADAGDQHLVVTAPQPAGRKTARERQLHLFNRSRRKLDRPARHRRVDRLAIVPRDVGDILGRFQPPLDLEARHAGGNQVGHQGISREVLRTEQILLPAQVDVLAVTHQFVRQPAGLCTLAAIRTAAAERFARHALARVGHAQCPVDEDLERQRRLAVDFGDLVDRQLAGENDPLDIQ